jgi:small-conductance mechanosensitive channel
MSLLPLDPLWRELLISAGILAGSYVAARLLSFVLGLVLTRAAPRTATGLDDRLLAALKRPVTYALFLVGAYAAVHRLPVEHAWAERLDSLLFTASVFLVSLALIRGYGIFVRWSTAESRLGAGSELARQGGPLLSRLGKIVIVLLAATVVLEHFGLNVQSLVVSLGVGSLAVGLAAQDTLANMFAGFTLMLDRPFLPGDRIQLSTGEVGDVETIGLRATWLKTLDETILVIPNSLLVKERVVNHARPTRRITCRVDVGVAYGSDVQAVKRILAESALASPLVHQELAPVVLLNGFGDFSLNFRVVFWAHDYADQGPAMSQAREEVYRRLQEAGIVIPFPTRTVIQETGSEGASIR